MNFGERRDVSLADLRRCRDYLTAVLGDGDELGGVTEMHIHPSPAPRYKVGDTVRWHLPHLTQPYPEERIVQEVRMEASYRLNDGVTWLPEAALEPVHQPEPRWVPCAGAHVETTDGRWLRERNCDHSDGKGHPVWRFCPGTHQRRHGTCCSTPWGFLDCPGDGWERQVAT